MSRLPNRLIAALDVATNELDLIECEDPDSKDNKQYLFNQLGEICAVLESNGYINGINSEVSELLSQHKILTYRCLELDNINYPKTYVLDDLQNSNKLAAALNWVRFFADQVGYPVVVKPNQGSHSQGVQVIHNYLDLIKYISKHSDSQSDLIVQEYIPGPEFKVVLHGYEIVIAYEKTSSELIKPYRRGETREVKFVTPAMHEYLIHAATSLRLNYCSIDIKTPSLDYFDQNNTYILELNCHPGINFMLNEKGPTFVRGLYKKLILDVISSCKINK